MKFFILAIFFSTSVLAQGKGPRYYWNLNQAATYLEKGQASEAISLLMQQLEDHPFDIYLLFNLGSSFHLLKENEKANGIYKDVEKSIAKIPPEELLKKIRKIRFFLLFNLGFLAAQDKKTDLAIEYYQKALDIYPNSREAKANIELLTNQNGGSSGEKEEQDKDGDKGDNKDDKEQKDEEKNKPQKNEDGKNKEKPMPTPQKFDSKELSKDDVRRILQELERQEGQIWQRMNEKPQEQQLDKDW